MSTPTMPPVDSPEPRARPDLDETPPVLGSWRNIYLVVLTNLACLVLVFWLITRAFN